MLLALGKFQITPWLPRPCHRGENGRLTGDEVGGARECQFPIERTKEAL